MYIYGENVYFIFRILNVLTLSTAKRRETTRLIRAKILISEIKSGKYNANIREEKGFCSFKRIEKDRER